MKPTERQRLNRFKQVRSEIRGSSSYLVIADAGISAAPVYSRFRPVS